ncbi:hypothetical protein E3E36_06960 [Thermococcus sp. M36]|uniref:hypothetical protein n=1 Tax=Thermococcus sp. M36 TaxID=1638261 RepID=UPI00143AD2E8|nr:hypothetical protein [Thermococcus sp. M36]NJE05886.1 hypothetical protein [Thermococcus sp. M36]
MKRKRILKKLDPSDGSGIGDLNEHEGFIQKDAYGDYDGDGVPNSVELFIGKDPAKPDVLGIKLTVAVGWNANEDYLKKLVTGFQRASQEQRSGLNSNATTPKTPPANGKDRSAS